MLNIIKSDFYRVKQGKLGYISAIVLFLLGLFLGALGKGYTTSELIESTLSSGSIFMPIIITNILVIVWGHEFNYRTVNNTLISRVKRIDYFTSKMILTGTLTVIALAIYGLSIVTSTFIFNGTIDVAYTLKILGAQLPLYLAVSSFGTLLFNLIDVTYLAITIFIVTSFIGDSLISMVIDTYLKPLKFLLDYLFMSNIGNMANIQVLPTTTIFTYIWSALICSVVFIAISYQLFNKKEFK